MRDVKHIFRRSADDSAPEAVMKAGAIGESEAQRLAIETPSEY